MEKKRLLEKLIINLQAEINSLEKTVKMYSESAIEAPGAMQSRSDTTKFEMELAKDKALNSLKEKKDGFEKIKKIYLPTKNGPKTGIGNLIKLEGVGRESKMLFLMPAGSGIKLNDGKNKVTVTTPESPLGSAVIGKSVGEKFNIGIKNWKITEII